MPKLSIVIPIYNEPSLAGLLSKLTEVEKELKRSGMDLETIFVDDGSDKRTSLEEFIAYKGKRENIRIIRLARNFGSFHAIKAGFGLVRGDYFATLSADLQDPPELLLEMAAKWQGGAKFVICVRGERDDPLTTRLFASLYYRIIRRFAITGFPASGFDLALMDKSMLPQLLQASVQINYRLLAYWMGIKAEVIEYKREKRMAGETHWGLGKRINLFIDSLIAFSSWPSRAIVFIGAFTSLASLVSFFVLLLTPRPEGYDLFTTVGVSILSFLLGLILMALALLAEYLWRIFILVSNKPEVVIEEIY